MQLGSSPIVGGSIFIAPIPERPNLRRLLQLGPAGQLGKLVYRRVGAVRRRGKEGSNPGVKKLKKRHKAEVIPAVVGRAQVDVDIGHKWPKDRVGWGLVKSLELLTGRLDLDGPERHLRRRFFQPPRGQPACLKAINSLAVVKNLHRDFGGQINSGHFGAETDVDAIGWEVRREEKEVIYL